MRPPIHLILATCLLQMPLGVAPGGYTVEAARA